MIVVLENNYLTIKSDDIELLESIYETLTFDDLSKAFGQFRKFDIRKVKKVRFARWEEANSLKIPIGFYYFLKRVLKDYKYKLVDGRSQLIHDSVGENVDLEGIELYDYQKSAITSALHRHRGIIRAPTGSGKTEVFLAILKLLKSRSLVLFNRVNLAQQTFERAKNRGLDVGIVQGKNVVEKWITMATIQSIEKIDSIKKYKNLIVDEAHFGSGTSYQRVLKMKNWERVYGFSATPLTPGKVTLKDAKIISFMGPVIFDIEAKPLMEREIIAKPEICFVPIDVPDDIDDFDYRSAEKIGLTHNDYRNNIISKIANVHKGENILILSKYVEQGENILKLIPGAYFIYNETKPTRRMELISEFEKRKFNVLIAARILDYGIDIKNIDVLIAASAGKGFIATIQRLGRGLRTTDQKKNVIVYDFKDNTHKSLYRHYRHRLKTYKEFGFDNIKELDNAFLRL
jgi:superfamily II DNA or RNA helicase